MTKYSEKKFSHMSLEDRIDIQTGLQMGMTFKAIAEKIGKDPTTVSKEVRKHIDVSPTKIVYRAERGGKVLPAPPCEKLMKAPYVCNGCRRKRTDCGHNKHFYHAHKAQDEYKDTLSDSREGIVLNKEEFYEMDRIIKEGLEKGQHLYQIIHSNDFDSSCASIYRYFEKGYMSASSIDLPRKLSFKPRRKKKNKYVPPSRKVGRTYEDYLSYIDKHGEMDTVQMDTVIGTQGGKVIMTFNFSKSNFMFGILLNDKTSASASSAIRKLKKHFMDEELRFRDYVKVLLTDNGGEFSDVTSFEKEGEETKATKLFFCDPMSPHQKPRVEKMHTLFRDIVPKGTGFDKFTQDTVNLIFSHQNSVKRKIFNGRTPYQMFSFMYGEDIARMLGIKEIAEDEVIQSEKLQRTQEFMETLTK